MIISQAYWIFPCVDRSLPEKNEGISDALHFCNSFLANCCLAPVLDDFGGSSISFKSSTTELNIWRGILHLTITLTYEKIDYQVAPKKIHL